MMPKTSSTYAAFFALTSGIFSGWLLVHFSRADPNWWRVVVPPVPIQHPGGWLGATAAQSLFVLCGMAAWVLPLLFCVHGMLLLYRGRGGHGDCMRHVLGTVVVLALGDVLFVRARGTGYEPGGILGTGLYALSRLAAGPQYADLVLLCGMALAVLWTLGTGWIGSVRQWLHYLWNRLVLAVRMRVQRREPRRVAVRAAPVVSPAVSPVVRAAAASVSASPASRTRPPLARWWPEQPAQSAKKQAAYDEQVRILERKLEQFGIHGSVVHVVVGPVVVLFAYEPRSNVPINKILARQHDLALALQTVSLRILAPIPGKGLVGFECGKEARDTVFFIEQWPMLVAHAERMHVPFLLGVTTAGEPVVIDIATLPHILVAGSTGSGKSVVLHSIITSILCTKSPEEVRLILIDPKRLEFALYADIPHLLMPVVTDAREAVSALRWAVGEMERRYVRMAELRVTHCTQSAARGEEMPLIVIVIDEWADLMMAGGKDAEASLVRLAQMARAAGIHVVVATQRPSVDIITGIIKVNVPARIACKVISKVDSRTIIDMPGAESLLGKGDMLVMVPGVPVERMHGCYISVEQIETVLCYLRRQGEPQYVMVQATTAAATELSTEDAELYRNVLELLKSVDEVSISLLQRRFRIGYNRSARMIDYLEARGMLLPSDGGKTRKVLR